MSAPAALDLDEKATWLADAADAIDSLVYRSHRTGSTFTADDLRAMIGEPGHPNWTGVAFNAARTLGVIVVDGFTISRTKSRHGGVVRVWRAA